MHRQYFWRGGITDMTAISGIDQALWDIKGKELGKPVCELLGGPVRDTLRFYDHLGGGSLEGMYKTAEPEEFGARIEESIAAGFTAVKAMPIPVSELIESPATLKRAARSRGSHAQGRRRWRRHHARSARALHSSRRHPVRPHAG